MTDGDLQTMPGGAMTPDAPVYLVLEANRLIAGDIAGSLRAAGPCEVRHLSCPGVLRGALRREPVAAVFLEMPYAQLVAAGLDRALADHGARIVLTVGEADEDAVRARGWGMLVRPFTDSMIRRELQGIAPSAQ